MWKFVDEADGLTKDEILSRVKDMLLCLYESGKIQGLRRMEIGRDVSGTDMSHDMVLLTEFDSLECLSAYKIHPDHVAISEYVKTVRTDRAVVDCEI